MDDHLGEPRVLTIHAVRTPAERAGLIAAAVKASIRDAKRAPFLRKLMIREVLEGTADRDAVGQANAIHRWIKANVRYIEDPTGLDWFPEALLTLWQGGEDCDGHTILAGAMGASVGFPIAVRIIHTTADEWHVYPLFGTPKGAPSRWLAMDTTWPGARRAGDEVPVSAVVPGHELTWYVDL